MRLTRIISLVILCSLLLVSCEKAGDCFTSTGNTVSENRILAKFSKIFIQDNVDLVLQYGSKNSCSVTAGKNLIDNIITYVENGVLYIENENTCNWVRNFKNEFIVTLTLDTLSTIEYRGVGDINCINFLIIDSLRIEVYNGWGTINLKYKGDYLRFLHNTGGVDFNAIGEANDFYMYLAGNGTANCYLLQTRIHHTWTKSTSNCYINVSENLRAQISYHGNIYFVGNPSVVNLKLESSGLLIHE